MSDSCQDNRVSFTEDNLAIKWSKDINRLQKEYAAYNFFRRFPASSEFVATCVEFINPTEKAGEAMKAGIVMHAGGLNLRQFVNRNIKDRKYDMNQKIKICNEVMDAVQFAHSKGVILGDIKPANFVQFDLEDRGIKVFKIIDLDSCKIPDKNSSGNPNFTDADQITDWYVSPERLREPTGPAHPAQDVFAVGLVLYFIFTGKDFFEQHAADWKELLLSEKELDLHIPTTDDWHRRVKDLLQKMVSKKLEDRPTIHRVLSEKPFSSVIPSLMPLNQINKGVGQILQNQKEMKDNQEDMKRNQWNMMTSLDQLNKKYAATFELVLSQVLKVGRENVPNRLLLLPFVPGTDTKKMRERVKHAWMKNV